jgi:putative drug exporter of the RND superfamily
MMRRISCFVMAHRVWVGLFWLVATVVGVATVSTTTNRLSTEFSVPGKEGFETSAKISQLYGISDVTDALVPVVQLPQGKTVDSPGVVDQLKAFDQQMINSGGTMPDGRPATKVISFASSGDRHLVSADGRTTYAIVTVPKPPPGTNAFEVPAQEKALRTLVNGATVAGGTARLTGLDELATSSSSSNDGPSLLVETLAGGFGALAILAFVFASFVAFVPIIIAVVAILSTFLVILLLTTFVEVSFIVQFLVALIGLGVAIDYSLLLVTRWREERAHGLSNDEAVHKAMETAGSAVVFSGTTVGIGLLALVVLPVPFLRSIGYGGLLIPVVSVLVAITLLPVILHSIGGPDVRWPWRYRFSGGYIPFFIPRLFRRLAMWPNIRKEAHASRGWVAWARGIVRYRWFAAGVAVAILLALLIPATRMNLGTPVPTALAQSGPAREGLDMLNSSGLGTVGFQPHWILTEGGKNPQAVSTAAKTVSGMQTSIVPTGPGWGAPAPGTAIVAGLSTLDPDSSAGRTQIDELRAAVHPSDGAGTATVGGSRAGSADFVSAVYGNFPLMLSLVVIITFILLARAFRSLLLPLKAVILNVLSVAAAYGILVLVWQEGHGSKAIFGIDANGAIQEWIPLMVFAFLFGLSMDYEVFILSRMREEYDHTGNTDLAVVRAMGRTGRLVTSAALILFLAFVALGSSPGTDIKVFATGLAAGILLDATVVRMLLVPALVSLFGRWNWWLPRVPARLIRVAPSEPTPERRRPVQPQEA